MEPYGFGVEINMVNLDKMIMVIDIHHQFKYQALIGILPLVLEDVTWQLKLMAHYGHGEQIIREN